MKSADVAIGWHEPAWSYHERMPSARRLVGLVLRSIACGAVVALLLYLPFLKLLSLLIPSPPMYHPVLLIWLVAAPVLWVCGMLSRTLDGPWRIVVSAQGVQVHGRPLPWCRLSSIRLEATDDGRLYLRGLYRNRPFSVGVDPGGDREAL